MEAIGDVPSVGLDVAAGLTPYALATFSGSELLQLVIRIVQRECRGVDDQMESHGYGNRAMSEAGVDRRLFAGDFDFSAVG